MAIKSALFRLKKVPKSLWVAATILPGGLVAVGIWLAIKEWWSPPDFKKILKKLVREMNDKS